jgi:hypothetical protein
LTLIAHRHILASAEEKEARMALVRRFRGLPTWLQIVVAAVVILALFSKLGAVQRAARAR